MAVRGASSGFAAALVFPAIGLVREFEVRGSLWGRYEVRNAEVTDLSASRALQPGSLWDVGARGVLFERLNPARRFDQYPNRVVAVHVLRTEIQVVKVTFPAASAVVIPDVSKLVIHDQATISGEGMYGRCSLFVHRT